jgi:hypothetical protein
MRETFYSNFDALFDEFLLGFGKPRKSIFNTNSIKDQMPNYWSKTDTGFRCIAKTLGVSEVSVTVEDYGIKLYGKSELFDKTWDCTLELPIVEAIMNDIIEIKTETKDGLTSIDLILDKPQKKKIKINGK